jgi:hypothetical protein
MATLRLTVTHDGSITQQDLRDALESLDPADLSDSSPVADPTTLSSMTEYITGDQLAEGDPDPTQKAHVFTGDLNGEFSQETVAALRAVLSDLGTLAEVDVALEE